MSPETLIVALHPYHITFARRLSRKHLPISGILISGSMARKTRTREHIIASQSVAHIEGFIAACGFTSERFVHDYGYDLNLYTYDADGGIENGNILLQLKATDHLVVLKDSKTISQIVDWADVTFWQNETMPVILIVYDASRKDAYWLYTQEAIENSLRLQEPSERRRVRLHLSKDNVVNEAAIKRFRRMKQIVQGQLEGKVKHYG